MTSTSSPRIVKRTCTNVGDHVVKRLQASVVYVSKTCLQIFGDGLTFDERVQRLAQYIIHRGKQARCQLGMHKLFKVERQIQRHCWDLTEGK